MRKNIFTCSEMLSFGYTKQTSKNVADTTFKVKFKKNQTNPARPTDGKSERAWENIKSMFDGK